MTRPTVRRFKAGEECQGCHGRAWYVVVDLSDPLQRELCPSCSRAWSDALCTDLEPVGMRGAAR